MAIKIWNFAVYMKYFILSSLFAAMKFEIFIQSKGVTEISNID